jgi:gamma-glutamyltranspeptidase/glutathione hydrolase
MHWDGSALQVEPGLPDRVVRELGRHWPVNVWEARDLYFGGAHLVADDGEATGDPRRGGVATQVLSPTHAENPRQR